MAITSASNRDPHPTQSVSLSRPLAKGTIAGAVVGGVVALTALILVLYFFALKPYRQRYRNQDPEELHAEETTMVDPREQRLDEQELDAQVFHDRGHELDARDQARNELDARGQARNELDAVDQSRFELDSTSNAIPELDACDNMPPRHELDGGIPIYELPTSEMSPSSTKPALADTTMERDTRSKVWAKGSQDA